MKQTNGKYPMPQDAFNGIYNFYRCKNVDKATKLYIEPLMKKYGQEKVDNWVEQVFVAIICAKGEKIKNRIDKVTKE